MAVHPAKLTTAGAAIYILSWLFFSLEQFKMGSQRLGDTRRRCLAVAAMKSYVGFFGVFKHS